MTIVNGPRQAGKTTLLRWLHAQLGGTFVTLDKDFRHLTTLRDRIGAIS
ncbi:MAG TPA: hypothetical protein VJT72_06380 [Pseudonocardiaceae bacterium]|nr:hypothetical protein [Pseudonocardiaceae bacterium]